MMSEMMPHADMFFAIAHARNTMRENVGGPFGAVIVDESGNIVALASNTVLADQDPTAHAEMNAIRKACKKLGTRDLSNCTLYTTCYPCPMCMSAIIWANIKTVYYGCTQEDADRIGFRDDFIYKYIQEGCNNPEILNISEKYRTFCLPLFDEYARNQHEIY